MTGADFDYRALDFWAEVTWKFLTLASLVAMAVLSRMKANRQAIEDLKSHFAQELDTAATTDREARHQIYQRLEQAERRVDQLSLKVDELPRRSEWHELAVNLEQVRGELNVVGTEVKAMTTAMEPMRRSLDRVQDYLLNQGKGP